MLEFNCWWTPCIQGIHGQPRDTFANNLLLWGRKEENYLNGSGKEFFFFSALEEWLLNEIERKHVREMINSELHYWKASLIRCSRLPGEPSQDCRLGSHCCFFHYQKFPHNTMAEKTTPLGAPMQENGCFKNTYEAYNECWELATDSVFVLSIKNVSDLKEGGELRWGLDLRPYYCPGHLGLQSCSGRMTYTPLGVWEHWYQNLKKSAINQVCKWVRYVLLFNFLIWINNSNGLFVRRTVGTLVNRLLVK